MMKPTPRQQMILDMRASGMTAREVGDKLGITAQAVKDHCSAARLREQREQRPPKKRQQSVIAEANRAAVLEAVKAEARTFSGLLEFFPDITPCQMEKACEWLSKQKLMRTYHYGKLRFWAMSQEAANKAYAASELGKEKARRMLEAAAARQRMAEDEAMKERQRVRRAVEAKALQVKTASIVQVRPSLQGVTIQAAKGGEAIITEKTLITVIPTPPGRFEVDIPKGKGVISGDWNARRLAEVQHG
jgi:predicted transcriptional regulator